MLRRALTPLIVALVITGISLTGPLTMHASDPDGDAYVGNLAGQPICGTAANNVPGLSGWCEESIHGDTTACAGIAYANVDGKMALLVAGHCRDDEVPSDCSPTNYNCMVYGPNGSVIGWWSDYNTANFDLTLIHLYQGNWPANRNRIARGDYSPNNNYWTIDHTTPGSLGCDNHGVGIPYGRAVYQNWQYEVGDLTLFRTGALGDNGTIFQAYPYTSGECRIKTSLVYHEGAGLCSQNPTDQCIDSGTPWVLCCNAQEFTTTLYGWATAQYSGGKILVALAYHGLADLYSYWLSHGSSSGAYICQTSTCGNTPGW